MYRVESAVKRYGLIVGYNCVDEVGNKKYISRDDAEALVLNNEIINMRATKYGDKRRVVLIEKVPVLREGYRCKEIHRDDISGKLYSLMDKNDGSGIKVLMRVYQIDGKEEIVIPSIVGEFSGARNRYSRGKWEGVFAGTKYKRVYIDNRGDRLIKVDNLFAGYSGEELEVVFRHPECIISMQGMFSNCRELKRLDIRGIDTRNVTNMSSLFGGSTKLEEIRFGRFDTSKVTSMRNMFYGCRELMDIDLSKFKTQNVTDMSNMFRGCESLGYIDISVLDLSSIKLMVHMFDGCKNLRNIKLNRLIIEDKTIVQGMFNGCNKLRGLGYEETIDGTGSIISVDSGKKIGYSPVKAYI